MKDEVKQKLEILRSLYKADLFNPFPYDDCRKLLENTNDEFEDLIPSLDRYFAGVAGLCSWGKRSSTWTDEYIKEFEPKLHKSFFQEFPEFSQLETSINEKKTPKLFNLSLIHI